MAGLILVYTGNGKGMEVINSGLHQTPEQIVEAAIQEDVKIIGIN